MLERNISISLLLTFFMLSVCVDHLYDGQLFGIINFSVQTFSMLIGGLFLFFFVVSEKKVSFDKNNNILRAILSLLIIVFIFQAMRSQESFRSMTYLAMLFLNIFIFLAFIEKLDMGSVWRANKFIYVSGVAILLVIFLRYLYVIFFQSAEILADQERWEVGSTDVYEVLFGRFIAFQGYAGDPNVVGAAVAGVLFCGMYLSSIVRSKYIHIINFVLILMIFASFSRGAIISLIIVFLFCGFVLNKKEYRGYAYISAILFLIGLMLSPVFDTAGYSSFNPLSKFDQSINRRADEWVLLFTLWLDNPFLGGGLRYDEFTLGKYAENSHLSLLVNTGLLGAFLYWFVMFLTYFSALIVWYRRRDPVIFPWIAYATYLIVSMGFISMEVKPHLWVTLSVLAAFAFGRNWICLKHCSRVCGISDDR